MPPDPKPSGQRRRRNKDQPKPMQLPAGGLPDSALVPAPPDGLGEFAAGAWASWWLSDMAAVWIDADVPALVRLARLTDAMARGEATGTVLGEIRQLEDRFGLSPLARRRLAWELDRSKPDAAPGAEDPAEDPRWLHAVSG